MKTINEEPLVVPELFQAVWEQHRVAVLDRIVKVETALRETGGVDTETGLAEAHSLHGLLGTFGFAEGSRVAGVAEELLGENDPSRVGWNDVADRLAEQRGRIAALAKAVSQSSEIGDLNDHRKVLLVDDEDHIRRLAEISMREVGGLETCVASSGEQALELARIERPDLILLDMMMPGMDGLETLRRLRDDPATDSIPVIFLTAKGQKRDIAAYLAAGAVGVIVKPFDPMLLPQQVRDITRGHVRPASGSPG